MAQPFYIGLHSLFWKPYCAHKNPVNSPGNGNNILKPLVLMILVRFMWVLFSTLFTSTWVLYISNFLVSSGCFMPKSTKGNVKSGSQGSPETSSTFQLLAKILQFLVLSFVWLYFEEFGQDKADTRNKMRLACVWEKEFQTYGPTDRWTNRPAEGWTNQWTNGPTDLWTDRPTYPLIKMWWRI